MNVVTNLTDIFQSTKPDVKERIAIGKSLRKKFPREMLGEYKVYSDRKDPVTILEEQNRSRIQELVPVRFSRMLISPFAFLRGGAAIMAPDLASIGSTSGINVQLCGDMHIANFGMFGTAERNIIFGINDYDETIPGPFEWDLKRLATSFIIAGRFLGADEKQCKASVKTAMKYYRKRMYQYAQKGSIQLHYSSINEKEILKTLSPTMRKRADKIINEAHSRSRLQLLENFSDIVDSKNCIRENKPFIVRETLSQTGRPIKEMLGQLLESYYSSLADDRKLLLSKYHIVDVARKVAGVGSVGTRCWMIFLQGNYNEDPLFLQIKEAHHSVLEPFVSKSEYANQGQRIVAGQRLIQGAPDIFLGWGEVDGIQYYIRQLRDMKGSIELDPGKVKLSNYPEYCSLCVWALALAHSKSGDAALISGYAGKNDEFDKAIVKFAFEYADQNEKDFKALSEAAKSGRINVAKSGS